MFDVFIKFSDYSLLVRSIVVSWIIFTAAVAIVAIFAKPVKSETKTDKQQSTQHNESNSKTIPVLKQAKVINNHDMKNTNDNPAINATNSNVFTGTNNGTINQNITNEFPEPKFTLYLVHKNKPTGNLYETVYNLSIDSKAAVKEVYIEAHSSSIKEFEIGRSGLSTGGHAGKREGYAFDTMINAYGTCSLIVLTSKPDEVQFKINYPK